VGKRPLSTPVPEDKTVCKDRTVYTCWWYLGRNGNV